VHLLFTKRILVFGLGQNPIDLGSQGIQKFKEHQTDIHYLAIGFVEGMLFGQGRVGDIVHGLFQKVFETLLAALVMRLYPFPIDPFTVQKGATLELDEKFFDFRARTRPHATEQDLFQLLERET
jgi:hypothetical protein